MKFDHELDHELQSIKASASEGVISLTTVDLVDIIELLSIRVMELRGEVDRLKESQDH